MPIAFITGITGQDGSYLSELLLSKGYSVHGLVRRTSSIERSRISHLYFNDQIYNKSLFLHYGDLYDITALRRALLKVKPDEVYHFAGQSHVGLSFELPESTCDTTAIGTLRLLEILRDLDPCPRFLHASSSEIFGEPVETPQNETTPINPINPYGCAKAFGTSITKVYREKLGLFAVNAICFNHESERRGENFVTKKICRSAARIKKGIDKTIELGNIDVRRDWGYAPDYVEAMWRMLQVSEAEDYVLATGFQYSLEDLLDSAFGSLGLRWQDHILVNERLMRPSDHSSLVGDSSKAREKLGWSPKNKFTEMVSKMVAHEMSLLEDYSGKR